MSQDYHHQAIFSFSNGFERLPQSEEQLQQQIRRDKLRVQDGFEPPPLVTAAAAAIQEEQEQPAVGIGSNETSGMLSEMFDFASGTARELLGNQISLGFNNHHPQQHQMAAAAAAMQLFPSPTSTLQGFHTPTGGGHFGHFPWAEEGGGSTNAAAAGEGQGLSLSLSTKAGGGYRIPGDGTGMLFFSQEMGSFPSEYPCKNNLNLLSGGGPMDQTHQQLPVGFGSSFGLISGLRNSKYAKAAMELLEEFCSVVRGHNQFNNKNRTAAGRLNPNNSNNPTASDGGDNSSSSKDIPPPLSAADRIDHQRRKVKLLSMLDEVDRRYNRYGEQMQMVVNSFNMVMGFGAAVSYTALAQKAMSRHFRCLKDAVAAQLKQSCEALGEKDAGASGLTKGETPRLKMLEQSLRQERAIHHQMGMMEQEAWRPQRGLPERSVNALRAWLFEHFLHPYPSDADKHMLARQTGLSRSQVSNWFINARVRLWKPMVEEMYQQEAKEADDEKTQSPSSTTGDNTVIAQTPTPNAALSNSPPQPVPDFNTAKTRSQINAPESNTSFPPRSTCPTSLTPLNVELTLPAAQSFPHMCHRRGMAAGSDDFNSDIGSTLMSFGTNASGNVSLTLGLRHVGNLPDNNHFFG